jgi:hypothetical protein
MHLAQKSPWGLFRQVQREVHREPVFIGDLVKRYVGIFFLMVMLFF